MDSAVQVTHHACHQRRFRGDLGTCQGFAEPIQCAICERAIAAAGLRRYGYAEESNRLSLALLDLAAAEDGRLPELIAGFTRDGLTRPVPYPTSCSPQTWAAASPLLLLRTVLGFDPAVPLGKLFVNPVLPPEIGRIHIERIPLAGSRITVDVDGDEVSIEGQPEGVNVVRGPRVGAAAEW